MNIQRDLIRMIASAGEKKVRGYDTQATVVRVEDSVVWVHIPGGVDETPIRKTIAARVGDTISIRVAGGRAWITGNASAPPTDDGVAIYASGVAETADSNANKAGKKASEAQETADAAQVSADDAMKNLEDYELQVPEDVENAINQALYGDDAEGTEGALGELRISIDQQIQNTKEELDQTISDLSTLITDLSTNYDKYATSFDQLFQFVRFPVSGSFTGIEIGLMPEEGQTPMQIKIGQYNGKNILMLYNGGENFGWWDGVDFHTGNIFVEVQEQARFGNFAFVPRSDGSLMFLKVADESED